MRMTTVRTLTKRMFVLLLTGLLLLPGNSIYIISARAVDEMEMALSEDVSFPEDTGFSENLIFPEKSEFSEESEEELSERAGIAAQNVSFLTAETVTSINENGDSFTERFSIPYATSKSMWFNDFGSTQVIRTHNDPSVVHYTGGKVEIVVYQEGVSNLYTMINGVQRSVSVETMESKFTDNVQYSRTRFTLDYDRHILDHDEPYTIFTAGTIQLTNPGASKPHTRHEVNVYIYWDYNDLPDAPVVSFAYDSAADKMVLSGANSTMEYRLKTDRSDAWQPCTDEPMYFDVTGTKSATYFVRYSAAGAGAVSKVKELVLPGKKAAPDATYDLTNETFYRLSNTMEIQFGDNNYVPLTGTTLEVSDIIDTIAAGETLTVNVRQKGTATLPSGMVKSFTLYSRAAAPTSVTFNPIPLTLTGCTTSMQYRPDTTTTWANVPGTTLNLVNFASGDRDVVVYVRTRPTSNNAASRPIEFTIPKLLNAPTGTLEYDNERISGLEPGAYQYSFNGTSWSNLNITDGFWKLSSLITTSARTLYLRKAGTSTTPITASTLFNMPRRPVAPTTPNFAYNDANYPDKIVFTGLTTDMEYRKSTDTNWIDVPASGLVFDPQTTFVTYYVRNKATSDTWASAYRSVGMSSMPKAPTIYYDKTTENLTRLGTAFEISFDGGDYTALTSSTYNLSTQIDNIPVNGTLLVRVRRKATSTAPAGQIATLTLNARTSTVADISGAENEFLTVPGDINIPVTLPDVEDGPVTPPDVEDGPVTPPDVEDVPVTPPDVEDVPVTPPDVEDGPVTPPDVEDVPVIPPDVENVPVTTPNAEDT